MSRPHSMETSALLRVVLEGNDTLGPLLLADTCYTSALTFAEATLQILAEVLPDLDMASSDECVRENATALGSQVVPTAR